MKLAELRRLKVRVAREYHQSPGGDLDGMLADITAALGRSGLFTAPLVTKTGGQEHLVEARCALIGNGTDAAQVASELERIWQDELRYDDFEAHAVLITDDSIILDFLTIAVAPRLYVTGLVVVDNTQRAG